MEAKASLISTNILKGDYFLTEFFLMGRVFSLRMLTYVLLRK